MFAIDIIIYFHLSYVDKIQNSIIQVLLVIRYKLLVNINNSVSKILISLIYHYGSFD